MMGDVYPELRDRRSVIEAITREEENSFRDVLIRGMRMLDDEMAKRPDRMIPGEVAFRLYDTYGFPFDLTPRDCLCEPVHRRRSWIRDQHE